MRLSVRAAWRLRVFAVFVLAIIVCAFAVPLTGAATGEDGTAAVSVKDVNESIFRIATIDENGTVITLGTGFAIGDSAPVSYVATSNHVIEDYKDNIMVWMNRDHFVSCKVVISLSQVDIAVLELEKPINKPPLPLGDSSKVIQGDQIYTFGFPDYDIADSRTAYPGDVTTTAGTISKKTKLNDIDYYQVDATVNPGNSGGPLFHKDSGSVIGIITIKSTLSDDINGAVYIERLIEALELESIPYITIDDFSTGAPADQTASPQASPDATQATQETDEQRGVSYDMLLKIGIALAVVAIALLIVALFLRMKDRKAEEYNMDIEADYPAEPAQKSRPVREQQPQERPIPPSWQKSSQDEPYRQPRSGSATVAPSWDAEPAGKSVRPVVRAMSGFFAGGVVPVGTQVYIGRDAASCQLVYPMDMTSISRRHVKITYDTRTGKFTITDMSTNGTFMESGKRLVKNKPETLEVGAQFYLSDNEEMFRLDLEDA